MKFPLVIYLTIAVTYCTEERHKSSSPPAVPPMEPPAPAKYKNPTRETGAVRSSQQVSDVPIEAITYSKRKTEKTDREVTEELETDELIHELKSLLETVEINESPALPNKPPAKPPAPVKHNPTREIDNGIPDISVRDYTDESSKLLYILRGLLEEEYLQKREITPVYTYGVNPGILASKHPNKALRAGTATEKHSCDFVRSVPSSLRKAENMWPAGIQKHYTKYTEAYGIPIVGSNAVSDDGMKRACYVVRLLFLDRYDVRNTFYAMFGKFALIGHSEQTTDLPDYSYMDSSYWDLRSRGLGAQLENPTSSAGDDNAKCCCGDRYPEEDIVLHELCHGVHLIGATYVIRGFERRLNEAYHSAMNKGLWTEQYASTNVIEYWAVGCTYYFNTRGRYQQTLSDGTKVQGTGQEVLMSYDTDLLDLLKEVFPCNNPLVPRCQYKDCDSSHFTKLKGSGKGLSLTGCQDIKVIEGITLEECYRKTCHRDGNAFNFVSGTCQIKLCTEISYTASDPGYNIYKLHDTVNHVMDLSEEMSQQGMDHCVQRHESLSERCSSISNPQSCGAVGKITCKKRGCCYVDGQCVYPKQDCMDDLITCHDGGHTCTSNPYFMLHTCPFTCGVCQNTSLITPDLKARSMLFCHDNNPQCSMWQASGECDKNPTFMVPNCPLSCKVCQGQPMCEKVRKKNRIECLAKTQDECILKACCWSSGFCYKPSDDVCLDEDSNCKPWADSGECDKNPVFMHDKCKLSCNKC